MKQHGKPKCKTREAGIALIIAIFALLLISVVAIALVVTSGTNSALQSNYRTSTASYYAALAGVEEARGRLLWKNPDCLVARTTIPNCPNTNFIPMAGSLPAMGLTEVRYILNPANGETVDPTSANPSNYPDTDYQNAFGWSLSGANVQTTPSVSSVAGLAGPLYKWVRISPATEKSIGVDVDGNGDIDPSARLYYEQTNVDASCNPSPGLVPEGTILPAGCGLPLRTSPTTTAVQVLEITSFAALPSGSRRLLQYVVAPIIVSPSLGGPGGNDFPAALTLDGNGVTFQDPGGAPGYTIDGRDACKPSPAAVESIGYTDAPDGPLIHNNVMPNKSNYPGSPVNLTGPPPGTYTPTTPSVSSTPSTLRANWNSPAALDGVVQDIVNSADVVINKPSANGSDISSRAPTMSASNPMTVVVTGDLSLNGWHNAGYGLLLVTGTLYYDPDASWNGLVLVIGQGIVSSTKNGTGGIQGAMIVAKTRDSSGNLLKTTTLGPAFFGTQTSYGSNPGFGILYNSCLAQSAQGPLGYKVLSFREIPLTN